MLFIYIYRPCYVKLYAKYVDIDLDRRKFRSQTSDNMGKWKSRGEKSQKREEQKRENQRRARVRRQKMQVREKVEKSRNTVFSQWFVVPEVRKVGSLKWRARNHVVRWEMKSCTPLWREAHFQVKMYKTPQLRNTFKSCDVEKVHTVVARSTFRSQKCKKLTGSDHFWKLRCRKSDAVVVRSQAHFEVKSAKNWWVRNTFGGSDVVLRGPAQGIVHLVKSEQNVKVF